MVSGLPPPEAWLRTPAQVVLLKVRRPDPLCLHKDVGGGGEDRGVWLNVDSGTAEEDVAGKHGNLRPFYFLSYATAGRVRSVAAMDHLAQEAISWKVVQRGERLHHENVLPAAASHAVGLRVALL